MLFIVDFQTRDTTKRAIVRAKTHAQAATFLRNELPPALQLRNPLIELTKKTIEFSLGIGEVVMMDINGDNE